MCCVFFFAFVLILYCSRSFKNVPPFLSPPLYSLPPAFPISLRFPLSLSLPLSVSLSSLLYPSSLCMSVGIKTTQDAKFYAVSAAFDKFSNEGKTVVVQFTVKHEQRIDCGGGYVKVCGWDGCMCVFECMYVHMSMYVCAWVCHSVGGVCVSAEVGGWSVFMHYLKHTPPYLHSQVIPFHFRPGEERKPHIFSVGSFLHYCTCVILCTP